MTYTWSVGHSGGCGRDGGSVLVRGNEGSSHFSLVVQSSITSQNI